MVGQKLVGDDRRADDIVKCPTARVADEVCVPLTQTGELGRVEAASMRVRIAKPRAGGSASSDLPPKSASFAAFAACGSIRFHSRVDRDLTST